MEVGQLDRSAVRIVHRRTDSVSEHAFKRHCRRRVPGFQRMIEAAGPEEEETEVIDFVDRQMLHGMVEGFV